MASPPANVTPITSFLTPVNNDAASTPSSSSSVAKKETPRPNAVFKTVLAEPNAKSSTPAAANEPMKTMPEDEWNSTVATLVANKVIQLSDCGSTS
jgi:hypothetical protein